MAPSTSSTSNSPTPGSLHGAYALDKVACTQGRWFDYSDTLGKGARLLIGSITHNPAVAEETGRHFRRKYWDRGKTPPVHVQNEKEPLILARTVLLGIDGVSMGPGQPILENTEANRIALLRAYEALADEVRADAKNDDNFRPEGYGPEDGARPLDEGTDINPPRTLAEGEEEPVTPDEHAEGNSGRSSSGT